MSCRHAYCYCKSFKESSSKWMKNKCNSCNHSLTEHGSMNPSNNRNVSTRARSMTDSLVTNTKYPSHQIKTYNFTVDDKLEVLYEDKYWCAKIIDITNEQIKISYDEWDEYSNEWINKNSDRLRKITADQINYYGKTKRANKINRNKRSLSAALKTTYPTQNNSVQTLQNIADMKYNDACDSEDEHDHQEVVVNGSDYRKEIHRFVSHRNLQIIKCIGQIETEYNYKIEHNYKQRGVGTGTVYSVTNNNDVFVLSCAHNIRHLIKYCTVCDTYNEHKTCVKCKKKCDSKKIIKPTFIEFHRYVATNNQFGDLEDSYECQEIYVPKAYEKHRFGEKGFDFAILMFNDDGYYAENCKDI
eukprot:86729_1